MLCMSKHVGGVKGRNNLWHLWHRYYLMVWLESPKYQLSKTFCGLKISWILRKLWVKMCICSFNTFDMHRHYSPQLFWATFNTFDIQSIAALMVHIELLSTPLTWVTVLCIEGPVCTFDTSDIHSLLILYWYYSTVFHTFDTSDMPFDLLLIVQYLAPLTPLTSKSHSIYNVVSNSKYSN